LHGVVLKKLGRLDEAIAAFEKVTRLKPKWYPGWVNLGTNQAVTGDLLAANKNLQQATELASTDDPYAKDTWRNLASLQLYLGLTDAAAANIEKAIQCNREDLASWLIQARLQLDRDVEAAADSARNANYLAEDREPKVKRILALANVRSGQHEKAIAGAGQAIELDDLPTINHLIIAIAQANLGRSEDARAQLERAEAAWPEELRAEEGFVATADKGILWFETAAELSSLRDQADELLGEH
ncbi:MAG: hypothetical protein ACYSUQ_15840, partial [Planctomycetota bacterium]